MGIKGKKCTDGTPVSGLFESSRKKVIRVCDDCSSEDEVLVVSLFSSRKRRGDGKDYCRRCGVKYRHVNSSNKAKRKSSLSRSKGIKFRSGGYLRVKNKEGIFVDEHRKNAEKKLGRSLSSEEHVHHIDGDKINNTPDNLFVCNSSRHEKLHKQLESLAFSLVKSGLIGFSERTGEYYLGHELSLATMPISLGFEDVYLEQNENKCKSRSDVSTKSEVIKGVFLDAPMMASNMSTVTNSDFCIKLSDLGALGVLHRAAPEEVILDEVRKVSKHCEWSAASIGVGKGQYELCKKLIKAGANIIFIDVAHGYSQAVIDLGKEIKKNYPTVKLVLGNTINTGLLHETFKFADAIKVGIGSGLACTTKNTAGCHERQFSAVLKFKEDAVRFGVPIISDGGIREPADFSKAIAAGANSIMAGSIFARCPESAAPIENGRKVYAGMASEWVQDKWRGGLKKGTCAEGKKLLLDVGDSVDILIRDYVGALKSGITYVGANDIEGLQKLAKFKKLNR